MIEPVEFPKTPILARLKGFTDRSAWLLVLVGGAILGVTDYRLLLTLVAWVAFTAVLAGITIMLSRVVFPTIDLGEWIDKARGGEMPAALIVAALLVFAGLLFNGVVSWAAR